MAILKPTIAAVGGYAVAGGLELSLMCDMRVADEDAVFGVFCRRFGKLLSLSLTHSLCKCVSLCMAGVTTPVSQVGPWLDMMYKTHKIIELS